MINTIGSFLKEFLSWRTFLDIGLTTAGSYFIYRTLKRLGSWKILLGIMMAIGIYLLAALLDLEGIIWIFHNLSQVAVIGFIILFQPEIRKFFETAVSTGRRDKGIDNVKLSATIGESLERLAAQNRGALFVFPGRENLRSLLSGGEVLNAEISLQLILSIFDPHSPGHDGAIVIENGKITRFGVRLPVSKGNSLSSEFGTRHYAAVGLSEQSDALVIAVSEERGTISIFHNGNAQLNRTKAQLITAVETHWKDISHFFSPLLSKKRLAFPWLEMAVCGLIASGFWYAVVVGDAEILEKVTSIPIEYAAAPKNLLLVGEKTDSAKVHLVGPKSDLNNLSNLSIKIDLSKSMPGKQILAISRDNINLPKRVQLLDTDPANLSLELARITEKAMTVKPQLVGRLPKHLKIKAIVVNPNQVMARIGLSGSNEKDSVLMTTPIYLGTIHQNTRLFGKIVAPSRIHPLESRWPDIEIEIQVQKTGN